MRVRKFEEEEWIEVAEENFGHREETELSIYGEQYRIAPRNVSLYDIDESSEGCAHVYGQIIKISTLLENDSIECVACANCKLFGLTSFSAESGVYGYCRVDSHERTGREMVNAAHDCSRHELAEDWKTRHGRT